MQDGHVGNWARDAQVTVETLDSLRELNHRFVDLVGNEAGGWCATHRNAPVELAGRVAPLSAAQRQALANCPYALFDLRFDDDDHWRARLQTARRWSVCDAAATDEITLDFVRVALFFAWHVAATARLAARFLLGMNETTVTAFRSVTIDCIPALAATESVHLTARWSDCPVYWQALTSAASRPNAAMLRRVQLSGLQLVAAAQLT
jgi:hypothetical protein